MGDHKPGGGSPPDSKPISKSIWVRVLVPVLILLAVVGIFFVKNASDLTGAKPTAKNSVSGQLDFKSTEFALDATEDLDLEKLLSCGLPVVIDFGADSCIPCKEMAPVLQELNEELRGKAIVKFVDVWKNSAAGELVPLSVIPTQFFFNADGSPYMPKDIEAAAQNGFKMYSAKADGKHVFTSHEGGMTKEEILAVLKEMGVE